MDKAITCTKFIDLNFWNIDKEKFAIVCAKMRLQNVFMTKKLLPTVLCKLIFELHGFTII